MPASATAIDPRTVDLFDDMLFERDEAHAVFAALRRDFPVHFNRGTHALKPFWSLTRYEDVLHVSRHPELFSSAAGITMYEPRDPETPRLGTDSLITTDPPRHVRLRRLVNKGFTPRAVGLLESHVREIAGELLDAAAAKGRCDFVLDVAAPLPLAVICELVGLERHEWPLMFRLTNMTLGSGDPEYQVDLPAEMRGTGRAARLTGELGTRELTDFMAGLIRRRRATPGEDDLISVLCRAEVDGDGLTDDEVNEFGRLLVQAGNETTRNAASGGLLALCRHPDEKERLLAGPALLPSAIEEILRWTSPVTHMARVATGRTEVRGHTILQGDRVVIWYASANRDEAVFPEPERFDITRAPNDHLAFGIGEHFCLGAQLARLELRVLFEELFRRYPGVALAGEPERLRSTFLAGIKHLPVTLAS
jgi:cytochrome P450